MAQRPVARQGSYPRVATLIVLLIGLLCGCASSTWRTSLVAGNWATVMYGDTLGMIAQRADVPLARLQRFNPSVDARHLVIGQRILIPSKNERAPAGGPYLYQVRPGDTYYNIAKHFGTTTGRLQTANSSISSSALRVGQLVKVPLSGSGSRVASSRPAPKPTKPAKPATPAKPAAKPPTKLPDPGPAKSKSWPWPLDNYRIVRHFGADKRGTLQPMLLSTQEGSQAKVVAAGTVSFAGSMRQLGEVVIVHHADNLQTVYALCDDLKVNEGQRIKAGNSVCSVGYSNATERYDLLFDVRHGGKPIDPRKVLR